MDYIKLLNKYMQGLTSYEEDNVLLHWIQQDNEAQDIIYAYYENMWEDIPQSDISAEVQHRMLTNIMNNIQSKQKTKNVFKKKGIGRKIVWKDIIGYAATILVILSISLYYPSFVKEEEKVFVIYAEKGQRSNLTLPDGTRIWLNSDSHIEYNNFYGESERIVKLVGEAFFEVSKDIEHRFIVKTEKMDIEALGTSFNVYAYPEENEITTTLVSGKVRVNTPSQQVILLPNQQASYLKTTHCLSVSEISSLEYANGWLNGAFSFDKISLEEISKRLGRMYNMKFMFKSEEIKQIKFTGTIKNNSLTNVLEIISITAPVTFKVKDDLIILDKRNN